MRAKNITILLTVFFCTAILGCARIADYLVGTPLINSITSDKTIDHTVKETITVAGTYEISYFIPTNRLSTPSDIALNSSGEVYVSQIRGQGIAKVSSAGTVSLWANTNSIGSYSLSFDSQDNLYSYFFPDGTIFKITSQGSVSTLFANDPKLTCYTESSISVNPVSNELYIVRNNEATGYATLYKVVNGALITLLDNLNYIAVLAFNKEGRLFLGMGNEIQELNLTSLSRTRVAKLPGGENVNHHGLALDAAGNMYVSAKTKLYKIDGDGVITFLASGFFYDLEGIAIAADNTIYAVDRQSGGVYKISESARRAEYLTPPSYICTPQALAFNSAGKLIVAEDEAGAFGTYSTDGSLVSFTSSIVYQPPLVGLAINSDDDIYISESAPGFADRLMLYYSGGGSKVVSTDLQKPAGLAIFNNELYVSEFDAGRISKVTSGGARETYVSGLTNPESIAFDPSGNLYVCAGTSELNEPAIYIEKIATDKTISRFADQNDLAYIQYDTSNDRLLASTSTGKVFAISPDGAKTEFISGLGSVMGIAFDASGNLYVADVQINTVYKFKKNP